MLLTKPKMRLGKLTQPILFDIFQKLMDTVFQEAVTRIIDLPPDQQRQFGEMLLVSEALQAARMPVIEFTEDENAMIDEGLAAIDDGRVVSQSEVEAFFAANGA